MAYGVIKVIPASSHLEATFSGAGGGDSYPCVKILNPNDGVIYVARNRDCLSVNYGDWDWKIPSQSYAMLPGPFSSVGMFYLDQSGAGRQGEISLYSSQQKLDDPLFLAIGRALQAQSSILDITEGTVPANPGAGILRLWADAAHFLHVINNAGVDTEVVDTLLALGGVLTGSLPAPGLATAAVDTTNIVDQSITSGKLALPAITLGTQIGDGVIGHTKIANGEVWTQNLAGSAVDSTKLAANAVLTSNIMGASVTADKLSLANFYSGLGSNVAMGASVNTWIDVFSVALAAGTWLLLAETEIFTANAGLYAMRITGVGSGVLNGGEMNIPASNTGTITTFFIGMFAADTMKVQVLQPVTNGNVMAAGSTSGLSASTRFGGFRIG